MLAIAEWVTSRKLQESVGEDKTDEYPYRQHGWYCHISVYDSIFSSSSHGRALRGPSVPNA